MIKFFKKFEVNKLSLFVKKFLLNLVVNSIFNFGDNSFK